MRLPLPPSHERDPLTIRSVATGAWRAAFEEAVADGWRYAGLWADGSDPVMVRAAFTMKSHFLLLETQVAEWGMWSVVGVTPAADWDEREAHDLYGVGFPAHPALRPLVSHDAKSWQTPVTGHDTFEVAVGPIHAGIIESGHFRFHVVGERILHLDLRLFYKHRGLERAAEGLELSAALPIVQRACAADAVTNAVAFAQACEAARGQWPEPALRRSRTLLLELERLYNHFNDISAICAGVGFSPGTMLFAAFKERAQRLNARLTGHRFLFDVIAVGRSSLQVSRADAQAARQELCDLRREADDAWRSLRFAGSAQERFETVGVLTHNDAEVLGTVGPVARASGVSRDAREQSPRLWYAGFAAARPPAATGDVAARLEMRAAELAFTFDCLDELLGHPIEEGTVVAAGDDVVSGHGLAVVESPRGQTLCAVRLDDDHVRRVHLRTGSYANWPALSRAVHQELLPDFPLVNKSFELCYACVDR